MPNVEVYTQLFCPYCEHAVHLLSSKGVEYNEIPAPQGSAAREEARKRSGGRTSAPQIFIDGKHIGGCDELVALDRAGRLNPLLGLA